MVRGAGLEPARLCSQEILSLSCLPIPPPARRLIKLGGTYGSRTHLRGFADLCVTAPPTRHLMSIIPDKLTLGQIRTVKCKISYRTWYVKHDNYIKVN